MDFIFDVKFSDDRRGNADAKVTINIPSGILAVLYWADENGKPLEDYLPIKALALIDGKAEYSLEHNRMIPENAKKYSAKYIMILCMKLCCRSFAPTFPKKSS